MDSSGFIEDQDAVSFDPESDFVNDGQGNSFYHFYEFYQFYGFYGFYMEEHEAGSMIRHFSAQP